MSRWLSQTRLFVAADMPQGIYQAGHNLTMALPLPSAVLLHGCLRRVRRCVLSMTNFLL